MTAAFIGLGAMGYPMAGHLARRAHAAHARPVLVWNRTREVAERHAAEFGSQVAVDVGEAAAGAEVVFTCLPTSREVDELATRLAPVLAAGLLWVDCTSGDPRQARETAARLAARGVAFVDAPVSGGVSGAREGKLTVMVGGEEAAVGRAREAIGAFAARVVHVGPLGAGHALKAINNTLLAVHVLAAAEGLRAAEASGIALETALEVLNASSGRSFATEKLVGRPLATGEFPLSFKLGLLEKDVRIGAAIVRDAEVEAPMVSLAVEVVRNARAVLGAEADYLELVKLAKGA